MWGTFGILAGKIENFAGKAELRERGNLRGKLKDLGELRGEKLEEVWLEIHGRNVF